MIENSQITHYETLFHAHGISPKSVGWRDEATQHQRFASIAKLFGTDSGFSVHEVGCGLGDFGRFLAPLECSYHGSDIVPPFVEICKDHFPGNFFVHNIQSSPPEIIAGSDYYCLNGTFHTIGTNPTQEWERFVKESIGTMFALCKKGVAINFLTSHAEYRDPTLYYRDPAEALNWCIKHLTRFVSIDHTLPLFEYTLHLYKPEWIKEQYPTLAERYL